MMNRFTTSSTAKSTSIDLPPSNNIVCIYLAYNYIYTFIYLIIYIIFIIYSSNCVFIIIFISIYLFNCTARLIDCNIIYKHLAKIMFYYIFIFFALTVCIVVAAYYSAL